MSKARIAVSYVRVSGLGQVGGDGPERQRIAIARAAKAQRLTVVREFTDLGTSGTVAGADREGMAQLIAEVAALGATVVLVERADRLARDLVVQELLLRSLAQLGVQVWTADGVNMSTAPGDATATLVRQLLGAVAEFDRAQTVAKLRAARDRKRAATGRCEGVKPFGSLAGEADALTALRRIARKQAGVDALTLQEIADKANAAGIRSRSGKPWSRGTVHAVLRR
jgi:DNA invertase Pin-like site-specific DNA recombinase